MEKKPVLFAVHGGPGSDHSDFKPWLTPLAVHMQIVYLDHCSNGQSDRVDLTTCTLDQLADDIEALRQYLGLGQISVLGHSFGGMVAQVYATRYPESLEKLLLVCTAPSWNFYADALEYASNHATTEQLKVIPEMFEGRIEDEAHAIRWWEVCYDLYFHVLDEDVMRETGNRPIGSLEVANYTFKNLLPLYDVRPKLTMLPVQTLIIGARYDWITPVSQAEEMHRLIPNSTLMLFEHSGHMPFIEEHHAFTELVSNFIRQDDK